MRRVVATFLVPDAVDDRQLEARMRGQVWGWSEFWGDVADGVLNSEALGAGQEQLAWPA